MRYNPEKHRRRSIRLSGYDYSKSGAYYITICSRDRECIFGDIQENVGAELASTHSVRQLGRVFKYSEAGRIIEKNWLDLSERFKEVNLDEYTIMPNHFHGIIMILNERTAKRAEASSAPTVGRIIQAFKSKCVTDYLKYIINNPLNWAEDEENPININKQKPTKIFTGLVPCR